MSRQTENLQQREERVLEHGRKWLTQQGFIERNRNMDVLKIGVHNIAVIERPIYRSRKSVDWIEIERLLKRQIGKHIAYNVFIGRILVRKDADGQLYLYDIVRIKKEACSPLEE